MIKKILPQNIIIKILKAKQLLLVNTPFIKKNVIITRNACLGNDVLELKKKRGEKLIIINQQKTRVDTFMDYLKDPSTRPRSKELKNFIKDINIFETIKQQEKLPWLNVKKNIKYIVIDCFSELTDKKFTHKKEGWSFCCHRGDIKNIEEFDKKYITGNTILIEEIERNYTAFFNWLTNKHPNTKIFLLHYPTKLEERKEYKNRAQKIHETLLKIERDNKNIYNIKIEESIVDYNEKDKFPYHYSKNTYRELLKKWDEITDKIL